VAGDDREPSVRTVRVGEFEFCHESGMLTRADGVGERLAPKPAALLTMLVARRGGLVTRTELREHLWSDVNVDFDNSLNYCVRQVRQAFGDSAGTPRYIETVPGRGYRLRPALFPLEAEPPEVERDVEPETELPVAQPTDVEPSEIEAERPGTSRRTWISVLAMGAATLGAGGWWLARRDRSARLRIAILPFVQPEMSPALALRCSQLEARMLADLTTLGRDFADVVGPRTTGPLVAENLPPRRIAATLGAHHLVGARIIGEASNAEILFELIRTSDGAHLYARRVFDGSPVDTVAATIVSGMLAALAADRRGG
jgi:DNA-binding winged helix-turn-helix (wHTH) protein/TolB-like protein